MLISLSLLEHASLVILNPSQLYNNTNPPDPLDLPFVLFFLSMSRFWWSQIFFSEWAEKFDAGPKKENWGALTILDPT